jgi:CRP-like cAMP-binding protein
VCDALFYILDGKVKLAVFWTHGKEATIAILNEGDFFGEARLLGQALRMGAATLLARPSATQVVQMEILADVGPFSPDSLGQSPAWEWRAAQGFCRFPGLDSTEARTTVWRVTSSTPAAPFYWHIAKVSTTSKSDKENHFARTVELHASCS